MIKEQDMFLSALTGRALRLTAEKALKCAVAINFDSGESQWWFKRACWLEYEASLVEGGHVDYREYWAGVFYRDSQPTLIQRKQAQMQDERMMAKLGDGIFYGL